MPYELAPFHEIPLDEELLALLLEEHESIALPRLARLWSYYRNALADPDDHGGSRDAPTQRVGLPQRLRNFQRPDEDDRFQREIVIENDIAWRIHTLVDFMFPSPPKIVSRAADPDRRVLIEAILEAVFDANGGAALWQNAALLGSIYGHVDFLLNPEPLDALPRVPAPTPGAAPSESLRDDLIDAVGSKLLLETVEAPRAIPLLHRADYRRIDAFIIHYDQLVNDVERGRLLERLSRVITGRASTAQRASVAVTEIISATHRQRYEDGVLVEERVNRLGVLPVVHVQNLSQPLHFEGLSDVEPLVPLQDELNTRLSDRANRVTMQSFRMWLGKGIDNFGERPIGPGQMWFTDNTDASIEGFGGDADSPSERAHIEELREALDKASGVTPAAAGHIKARVGNLTSENALRISLMGTIAKIKRKRVTYGTGIRQLCELILHALHVYGVLRTQPPERRVDIAWQDALPVDETRRLTDALTKAELGIPLETLRAELGYAPDESDRKAAAR